MTRFLSSTWLDAMAGLAEGVPGPGGDAAPLTLRQCITDTDRDAIVYDVRLAPSGVDIVVDPVDDADVVFEQDLATATALARGELHPELALSTGRLRVSGAAEALRAWRPTLEALDRALEPLRADTGW